MTHEELDRLWFQAMEESIRDGEMVARYRFAALVGAAELRRLHAECEHHKAWVAHITAENKSLEAQRDALLAALKNIDKEFSKHGRQHWPEAVKARAAIKQAEEKV